MAETFTDLERRKILAILGTSRDLIKMSTAKIYTTSKDNDTWLFSDLEGFLCFILDHHMKTRYFVMLDSESYERLFQLELYKNFQQSYQALSDDFYCFEYCNGFIGFKFYDKNEANMFNIVVNKFDDNFSKMLFDTHITNKNFSNNKKNEYVKIYCNILKDQFAAGGNNFDENYIEDGLEICKPRYFDLMNNITYDRERKEFIVDNIPQEFKKMFKSLGLKKSDFKNVQLALNIFKHFIETIDLLDNQKREKCDKSIFQKGMKNNIMNIINNTTGNKDKDGNSFYEKRTSVGTVNSGESDVNSSLGGNTNDFKKEENNKINIEGNNIVGEKKFEENKKNKLVEILKEDAPSDREGVMRLRNATIVQYKANKNKEIQNNLANKVSKNIIAEEEVEKSGENKINLQPIKEEEKEVMIKKVIPVAPKLSMIPVAPKLSIIPVAPKLSFITPTTQNKTETTNTTSTSKEDEILNIKLKKVENNDSTTSSSLFDEMKKVQLKKVDPIAEKRPAKINMNETNILQNSLAEAIKQRRMELTKHDVDSDDNDSDWSD